MSHRHSSMKIGVDAVLLGAWAGERASRILDVGTGCGVIALILAQRFPGANITAVDIDRASIEEAKDNFRNSPWGNRLKAIAGSFPQDIGNEEAYDLIVSNPPYFNSGVKHPGTAREKARHQDTLSMFSLLEEAGKMLNAEGKLAMIFPTEFLGDVEKKAFDTGWYMERECLVRDHAGSEYKRVMTQFGLNAEKGIKDTESMKLTMFEGLQPTQEYRELCKEFYLKF